MKQLANLFLFWLCIPSAPLASQVSDSMLPREVFAQGMELTPTTASPVQTLLLPASVYRGLSNAQLHDLRVFNSDGEEVPYALRTLIDAQPTEHASVELPLFAIHAKEGEDILMGDMSLQLRRSDDGRLLEVTARNSAPAGAETGPGPVVAYVLDLSSLERPVVALNLSLQEDQPSFVCSFVIEASSDLSAWSTLAGQATFASLEHDGTRLVRTRIPLPAAEGPYLRLRWLEDGPPVQLESAVVELQSEAGIPERRSVQLEGTKRAGEANVYDYPSPGPLPINRIQVELPTTNTLIQAQVMTAATMRGAWRTVLDERFFRISNEVELRNEPHPIGTHSATHWALFVSPQGGGVGQGVPKLELEYFPHQLAFVARGEGPFTLAFGKYGADAARFNWEAVTEILSTDKREALPHESVTKGAVFNLAGLSVLNAPVINQRPKKILLWAILILGVALLGGISRKLMRTVA